MSAIPESDLTMDEQLILKDFDQRRRASERMTVYFMAVFVTEHWDDFAAFLDNLGENPKYFEPRVAQWRETHDIYRIIHNAMNVSDADRDQLGRLKEHLERVCAEIEWQAGRPSGGGVFELWKKRNAQRITPSRSENG
jgi:hypothetical protein